MASCNNNQSPIQTRSNDAVTGATVLTELLNGMMERMDNTGTDQLAAPQQRPQQQIEHFLQEHYHHNQHMHAQDWLLRSESPLESPSQSPRVSLQTIGAIDRVLAMLEEDLALELFRDVDEQ